MKPIRSVLNICVLSLFAPMALAQRPPDPAIEVYIPTGMPIRIEVSRDENEQTITKLNINRIVGPEVRNISVIEMQVGPEHTDSEAKNVTDGRVVHYSTYRVREPSSAAWASSVQVARFIIIVERIDTDTGSWVIDADDQTSALKDLVKRGLNALPRAKFIKKE